MKKVLEGIAGIFALFPKFFTTLLILSLLLGAHQMHHILAVGWDDVTTVIFGNPGIPIPIHINNK
jgi:hypothetical protein